MNCKNNITLLDSNHFGDYLYIFYKNHSKYVHNKLLDYDLNLVQVLCIFKICKGEELCQKDLADEFYLTKGAITKAIAKLVDNGIVSREKSVDDKRQYVLNLTQKGEDLIPVLEDLNLEWESELGLKELNGEFIETFKQLTLSAVKLNE